MATPHNTASVGEFAKTVLMPGDPLRAKFIAETYLTDARLVNDVRGIQGYTGYYHGKKLSVMASGMGMPSMGIYSYELFHFYGVENIIRVGTTGGIRDNVAVFDVVLAEGACTDSSYASKFSLPGTFAPTADFSLLKRADEIACQKGIRHHVGNVVTSDQFYTEKERTLSWGKMGVLCVDMETAALYMNAAFAGKKALSILTVSDHLVTNEETTSLQRERSFSTMIELALATAESLEE